MSQNEDCDRPPIPREGPVSLRDHLRDVRDHLRDAVRRDHLRDVVRQAWAQKHLVALGVLVLCAWIVGNVLWDRVERSPWFEETRDDLVSVLADLAGTEEQTARRFASTGSTFEDLQASASQPGCDDLLRYTEHYEGARVWYRGKVVQLLSRDDDNYQVSVNIGPPCDDDRMVLAYSTNAGPRLLDDDPVRFVGVFRSVWETETVLGVPLYLPVIDGIKVEIATDEASPTPAATPLALRPEAPSGPLTIAAFCNSEGHGASADDCRTAGATGLLASGNWWIHVHGAQGSDDLHYSVDGAAAVARGDFTLRDLAPGSHRLQVVERSATGWTGWSAPYTFTIRAPAPAALRITAFCNRAASTSIDDCRAAGSGGLLPLEGWWIWVKGVESYDHLHLSIDGGAAIAKDDFTLLGLLPGRHVLRVREQQTGGGRSGPRLTNSRFGADPASLRRRGARYARAGPRTALHAARPNPPSRCTVSPTSIGASPEQSQATAAAMSSGRTLRPAGTWGRTAPEMSPR